MNNNETQCALFTAVRIKPI